ncbi:MAG: hypothetical protein WCP97_09410, partial [bacterium]
MLEINKISFEKNQEISPATLTKLLKTSTKFTESSKPVKKINEVLAEREKLRNDDIKQDIQLKKTTLIALLIMLGIETAIIYVFAFFQATYILGFRLEEWSFRLLLAATITQIYLMLRIAVEYLF